MTNSTVSNGVNDLLAAAHKVARYGSLSGTLTDSKLFEALYKADAKSDLSPGAPEVAELQRELALATSQIRPVYITHLNDWDPFDPDKERVPLVSWRTFYRVGVLLFAFMLIFLCAYYTIWNKQSTRLLNDIAMASKDQQSVVVEEVFEWITLRRATGKIDDSDKLYASLQRINANNKRYQSLTEQFQSSQKTYFWWRGNTKAAKDSGYGTYDGSELVRTAQPVVMPVGQMPTGMAIPAGKMGQQAAPDTTPVQVSEPVEKSEALDKAMIEFRRVQAPASNELEEECVQKFAEHFTTTASEAAEMVAYYSHHRAEAVKALGCIIGIKQIGNSIASEQENYALWSRKLLNQLEVLGRWLLPGIYGALGAILFTLRSFLNPIYPDPHPATVSLRVFLGGFSGVVVGWFWTSELSAVMQVSSVSLGLLTVAFLFGFGIDIFFGLLDRLVVTASNAVARIGNSPAQQPTTK